MKRIALFTALLGLAFAAAAQTAAPAPAEPAAEPAVVTPAASAEQADALENLATRNLAEDRNCLRETGSRVIRADSKGRKCVNAPGRSYTREDINSTGAVDLADALRRLDPSIR